MKQWKDIKRCLKIFVNYMNKQTLANREIGWINALKAICIIFIYVHHCEFYCEYDLGVFRSFYKPFFTNAFFFISGYLVFRKQLSADVIKLCMREWMPTWGGQFLSNVLFKLIIPTMLFTALTFLPKMMLRGGDLSWFDGVKAIFLGESYWFTCALVVSEIMIFFLLLVRTKSIWLYLLFGIITISISLALNNLGVRFFSDDSAPWYYKSGLVATFFLALGGLYWKYEDKIDSIFNGWRKFYLISLLVVYLFVTLCYGDYVNCIITNGTINLLGLLMMIIATYLLIYICKRVPDNKYITYVGRHSIGFYFFCGAIPNILAIVLFKLGLSPSVATTLISSAITILIAYPIVYLVNRFVPFLFDIRLIGKNG